MSLHTVKSVDKIEEKPAEGEYRAQRVFTLTLQEYGQEPKQGRWWAPEGTPTPAVGSQLDCTLEQKPYGWKINVPRRGGGGGGRGGRSPEENRRIVRQHSQHMAIRWVEFKQLRGELPAELTTPEGFRQLIDWFHKDAMEGGQT